MLLKINFIFKVILVISKSLGKTFFFYIWLELVFISSKPRAAAGVSEALGESHGNSLALRSSPRRLSDASRQMGNITCFLLQDSSCKMSFSSPGLVTEQTVKWYCLNQFRPGFQGRQIRFWDWRHLAYSLSAARSKEYLGGGKIWSGVLCQVLQNPYPVLASGRKSSSRDQTR